MSDLELLKRLRAERAARGGSDTGPGGDRTLGAILAPPPPQPDENWLRDPRPDLPASEPYTRLLALAYGLDGDDPWGLFGAIHGFRCAGAVLERTARGWKLAPTIDATERVSAWQDREGWNRYCEEWLQPHISTLRALLKSLATEVAA